MPMCAAAIQRSEVSLWVISVISKRGTDVRFTPNSDRDSDIPRGRYVPLATKVQRSKPRLR
jgi:hypothetical protein